MIFTLVRKKRPKTPKPGSVMKLLIGMAQGSTEKYTPLGNFISACGWKF